MAENSIELVRGAEAEAEEVARKAAVQAGEIIKEAQEEAEKLILRTEDEATNNTANELNAARAVGQANLEKAQTGLSGELDDLAAKARKSQGKAVQLIVESLV